MKLAILSCGPHSYSTKRLKEAAIQRGHNVKVLNTLKFAIDLEKGSPDLYYKQKELSTYDAVISTVFNLLFKRLSNRSFKVKQI